ncbi:MAG: hypothetical protein BWY07_01982 [Candidatus Hydrogenedentes bacterium ADurb.Bin170]|nr:MAG: hypothetical protein BWY07_01982 [Candidatus Hydrogenedentes bacterium ADurb.Bin170]
MAAKQKKRILKAYAQEGITGGKWMYFSGADAVTASQVFGLALTVRHKQGHEPLPLAGFPVSTYPNFKQIAEEAGYTMSISAKHKKRAGKKLKRLSNSGNIYAAARAAIRHYSPDPIYPTRVYIADVADFLREDGYSWPDIQEALKQMAAAGEITLMHNDNPPATIKPRTLQYSIRQGGLPLSILYKKNGRQAKRKKRSNPRSDFTRIVRDQIRVGQSYLQFVKNMKAAGFSGKQLEELKEIFQQEAGGGSGLAKRETPKARPITLSAKRLAALKAQQRQAYPGVKLNPKSKAGKVLRAAGSAAYRGAKGLFKGTGKALSRIGKAMANPTFEQRLEPKPIKGMSDRDLAFEYSEAKKAMKMAQDRKKKALAAYRKADDFITRSSSVTTEDRAIYKERLKASEEAFRYVARLDDYLAKISEELKQRRAARAYKKSNPARGTRSRSGKRSALRSDKTYIRAEDDLTAYNFGLSDDHDKAAEARAYLKGKRKTYSGAVRNPSRRRNNAAAERREQFSGAYTGDLQLYFPQGTPGGLSTLGPLVSIKLTDGKTFAPTGGQAWLCQSAKGRLYIGTEAKAPLYSGSAGNLGTIKQVEYLCSKPHLGEPEESIYYHNFEGRRPQLRADNRGDLHFHGGSYTIEREGITG